MLRPKFGWRRHDEMNDLMDIVTNPTLPLSNWMKHRYQISTVGTTCSVKIALHSFHPWDFTKHIAGICLISKGRKDRSLVGTKANQF